DLALERFSKLEELFPKHRLADDARFHGALVHKDRGDEAQFASMMGSLSEAYPEGDMRTEADFRIALLAMAKRQWSDAKAPLERVIAAQPEDHHWATAGRAAYFLAKIADETGDHERARRGYADVITKDPLAFYMGQAYARLSKIDTSFAKD